ncbi:amidohydrolase family protein, partial [Xanthomonas sp. Kuri4-1]
ADADAARAAVRAQADAGADLIKLWVDDLGGQRPMMAPAVYRAAIEEAHKRGLKVAAHIHDLAPAADLVASGLDILAHGVRDQPIGPDLVKAMFAAGTWYIPTVTLDEAVYYYAEHPKVLQQPFLRNALSPPLRAQWNDANWRRTRLADPSVPVAHQAVATNLANLRTLRDAGIRIGFGTDAGALPQRVIGFAEHRELELMVQAGFSPSQALTTATRDASKLLGLKDRGRIVPGLRADLLVLEADPTRDILNTRRIVAVWQAGVEVGGKIEDYRPR